MLNSPLIEVDAQRKVNEIQEKYLELQKGLNKLNEINDLPDNKLITELDTYKRLKHLLKNNFVFLNNVIDEFNTNLEDESQTYYSTKTRKTIKEVLNKIDMNKLKNQEEEYKKIVDKIDKRTYRYINIEEQKKKENENESKDGLKMIEISNNEELLKKRTNELLDIKNISAQVAEMSTSMNIEINEQGKKLDTIESNIELTEEYTKKAYKEALETEVLVNKSKKKLYCLAFLTILLISAIIYIISKIIT